MPNGIIIIDKPAGWTSQDVAAKLRGVFHERRIGHSGTLDPMATGVLVLFVGRATRAVEFAERDSKEYLAGLRLGLVTNTQDTSGETLETHPVAVTREELDAALDAFRGDISQIPPMYSAIKIGGKKLYELARKGQEVERKPRNITIFELAVEGRSGSDWDLRVRCSKGTYVRTLCHDIGQSLGCGGCMSSLRRTRAGRFTLEQAVTMEQILAFAQEHDPAELLMPVDAAFRQYKSIFLSPKQSKMFLDGIRLDTNRIKIPAEGDTVRVYGDGRFLALAHIERSIAELQIIKLFYTKENPNC